MLEKTDEVDDDDEVELLLYNYDERIYSFNDIDDEFDDEMQIMHKVDDDDELDDLDLHQLYASTIEIDMLDENDENQFE